VRTLLLDANVLIALIIAEHEHHDRVSNWAATEEHLAVSPIAEGALVRFLVRIGERTEAALALLRAIRHRCELWSADLSYADASLGHIRGHRQVTDAYLAALAVHHGGLLATLDEGLASVLPDATALIPRS
jgi:predicted nucleic acid-binding protein